MSGHPREDIEIVAARGARGLPRAGDLETLYLGDFPRQQMQLDFVSRSDFRFLRLQFHLPPGHLVLKFCISSLKKSEPLLRYVDRHPDNQRRQRTNPNVQPVNR